MKTILTYGTFDLFHIGHLNLLKKLKGMGDHLIVGVSTDEFNLEKGKHSIYKYQDRADIVAALEYVDCVIPEHSWKQKVQDIQKYNVDVFAIGNDWQGKFDELKSYCEVIYLPRTENISSTAVKESINALNAAKIDELKTALDGIKAIINTIQ